jgi:hypothetical protein
LDSNLEDKIFCPERQQAFPDFSLLLSTAWMEFRSVKFVPYSWTVSSFQRTYCISLRCDFVVHSDLARSIQVCRYLL